MNENDAKSDCVRKVEAMQAEREERRRKAAAAKAKADPKHDTKDEAPDGRPKWNRVTSEPDLKASLSLDLPGNRKVCFRF